jgi:hypothetical protein
MLGESCAKELWKIPLADNTMGRKILSISEKLCDQFTDQLKPHILQCKYMRQHM